MLELGLKALLAYLLGSLIGSLLLGRLRGVDIREQGSGNAGGTNALRTQGWAFALGVVVVDVGKALLAVGVCRGSPCRGSASTLLSTATGCVAACASAVVVATSTPSGTVPRRQGRGHADRRGGRPRARGAGAGARRLALLRDAHGYVGLGTMLGTRAAGVLRASGAVASGLLARRGHGRIRRLHPPVNIARMRTGTESRAHRLWLLRPR